MGLPIKVGNAGVQLVWTPNTIYRGSLAYDSTTLAPDLSKSVNINNDANINFFPYIVAGKNSLRYASGGYFHCKNSNDFYCKSIFSPAAIGDSGGECYLTVSGNESQQGLNISTLPGYNYYRDELFYTDPEEDNCFYSVESTLGGATTVVQKYRLQNSQLQTVYSVTIALEYGTANITKISNGIVYITGVLYQYSSRVYYYCKHYKINQYGVITELSSESLSNNSPSYAILPSRDLGDHFYAMRLTSLVKYKENMLSFDTVVSSIPISFSSRSNYYPARGELIVTTSKENDEYISFVDRNNKDGEFLCYSQSGKLIQKISNTPHFIMVDENNVIVGNGNTINKLQWDQEKCEWIYLSRYTVGELYKYFTLDPSGTLWVHGETQIHRILPGQGIKLCVEFAEDIYRWNGFNINTSVSLQIVDQTNRPITTNQEIELSGPIKFTDGTTIKTVSFNKENKVVIPVVITGPNEINCSLKF